jgi:CcmD family protein
MTAFAAAYLLVWAGVLAYLIRLGVEQRRLRRDLDALHHHGDDQSCCGEDCCRAA